MSKVDKWVRDNTDQSMLRAGQHLTAHETENLCQTVLPSKAPQMDGTAFVAMGWVWGCKEVEEMEHSLKGLIIWWTYMDVKVIMQEGGC